MSRSVIAHLDLSQQLFVSDSPPAQSSVTSFSSRISILHSCHVRYDAILPVHMVTQLVGFSFTGYCMRNVALAF
jgi:hypothetical protein